MRQDVDQPSPSEGWYWLSYAHEKVYPTEPVLWDDSEPTDGASGIEDNEENYGIILNAQNRNGIIDAPDLCAAVPICQYPAGVYLCASIFKCP